MGALTWISIILGVVLIGLLVYWQLILAEGAYLGRYVVALLYNWSAHIYDRIKAYDPGYEQWFLGRPLCRALALQPDPLLLDVATGTARLARTLFAQESFRGRIIGLDYSRKMLQQAVNATEAWQDRVTYLWQDASDLPFPDAVFDAVTCLEALEFMPDPDRVLQELVRVLRPGGILLITNRIGKDARWLPGRTQSSTAFEAHLQQLPLEMTRIQPWQEDYDLVWSMKTGARKASPPRRLANILRCPHCGTHLHTTAEHALRCEKAHTIPVGPDGIIDMVQASSKVT